LVLLARMFALAFLVLGFAQPFIGGDDNVKVGNQSVSIFIDNSFSMGALSEDVSLLEKSKIRAKEIVEAFNAEDEFQILTNDFEGRHQRLVGQEDAISFIEEIKPGPAVKKFSTVFERQKQALQSRKNDLTKVYWLSDFQSNISDLDVIQDTTVEVNLIPLQSVQENNVSIDSAWFEAPVQMLNQTNNLLVKIKNHSNQEIENIRLSLQHENQSKPVGTLSLPAQSSLIDTVPITILRTGWHEGKLTITDYPVQFDDTYFFSFYVAEQIKVLSINEEVPNNFLNAVFKSIPSFELTNQNNKGLEYSKFPGYQLIILNGLKSISSGLSAELNQYVTKGGNVLVFPAQNADLNTYNTFFRSFPANDFAGYSNQAREVGNINTSEFIFKDVYENRSANLKLPSTQGNYTTSKSAGRTEEILLSYRDGSAYFSKYKAGQGHLYVCMAPLDEGQNNLVRNSEVFVPMLYKTAISSARERKIAYTIGKDQTIDTETGELTGGKDVIFKLKGEKEEFIPGQRIVSSKVFLTPGEELNEAGIYDLYLNPDEVEAKFAFNFDRAESDLNCLSTEQLESIASGSATFKLLSANDETNFTDYIGQESLGISLWKWCLMLALFFLAIEGILLRIWKV
ncbi:MAG: VWA domain-containing protein, partial [Saprospiraceae bacterium]|nr:VWA domain-containing protein [Saprospiraceae bacterium]